MQYAIGWWSSMTVGGRNSRNPKLLPYSGLAIRNTQQLGVLDLSSEP